MASAILEAPARITLNDFMTGLLAGLAAHRVTVVSIRESEFYAAVVKTFEELERTVAGTDVRLRFWLTQDDTHGDADEQRAGALREDAQHALRARPVAVVASVGFEEGVSTLRERMRALGFKNAIVDVMLDAATLPTVDSVLDGAGVAPSLKDEFLEECRRIGDAVLNDGEERHDDAWRADKALGYGNHKTLVVSSYNTPTICLTALWAKGTVDGIEWRPLLPRRKKK
ncbi:hypothetical protein [Microbacterium sp. NPDC057658]|uniref:phosphoribosyltransferase-like protein n=1 Tax=unclassified Microbacterium TaxID=2609290 RepID=UPI00366D91B0